MKTIKKLTEEYINAGEKLFKAEEDLEIEFAKRKDTLPERETYRQAERALSHAVETSKA